MILFIQRHIHKVVHREAGGIVGNIPEIEKLVSIKPAESVFRDDPQKTTAVAPAFFCHIMGQPVFRRVMVKPEIKIVEKLPQTDIVGEQEG
jgi:hypothetical protein